MKKKITLLGGSGFLGSHVADELSKKGYEVTILDIKNSKWLRDDQKFVKGNILNDKDLEKVIKKSTYVFNFASISDIEQSLKNPLETAKVNIIALIKILKLCVKHKINQYVHASTVYVSGNRGGFYKSSKIAAESYVEEFYNIYGLKYSILRYGTLYGERSDKNNGLHQIIKTAILKKKIEYSGDVNAMRDYINVIDAAKASTKALTKDFQNKVVIISGHQTIKVSDMLEIISEMMSLKKKIKHIKKNKVIRHSHYVRTPYSYQPNLGRKYIPPMHVDLGQGLLQVINELYERNL